MSEPFLSSDEYDERAHQLYNDGKYDEAIETLREGVLDQARRFFQVAITAHPDSADAAACVGYASHRLCDEGSSLYWLRRALELEPLHAEARIYLANLLYDRGEYEAALFHLERTQPEDHCDGLAIWRLIELKRGVYRLTDEDPELE